MSAQLVSPGFPDPGRFDFAILAVNEYEDEAVRQTFGLIETFSCPESGKYYGTTLSAPLRAKHPISVVYKHTADDKGFDVAKNLTSELRRLFNPRHILILGVAAAVHQAGHRHGQIVFSKFVRSSVSRKVYEELPTKFEERRILPPDDRLIRAAAEVAKSEKWIAHILEALASPPADFTFDRRPPAGVELFSGPEIHEDQKNIITHSIMTRYPRVSAFEMEAEGVAAFLLQSNMFSPHDCGYLLIKGISDLVDDPALPSHPKAVRDAWAPFASVCAAAFAKELALNWARAEGEGCYDKSVLPRRFHSLFLGPKPPLENQRCLVFHNVTERVYSDFSRACTSTSQRVFTVCAFPPSYFVSEIASEHNSSPDELRECSEEEFLRKADMVFPHFRAFRKMVSDGDGEVTRVVLPERIPPITRDSWIEREAPDLQLFLWLNGLKVPCYIADTEELAKDLELLTDHVIFDSFLCLDYYTDSKTLLMTFAPEGRLFDYLQEIPSDLAQRQVPRRYLRLIDVVNRVADLP